MLFNIISISPNDRETYQKRVQSLCEILKNKDGQIYRNQVFMLLTISGQAFSAGRYKKFSEHPRARLFMKQFPIDLTAIAIMGHLDDIYSEDTNTIDNLRGAVGEVFSYLICQKLYKKSAIEAMVEIRKWQSNPIDAVGCSEDSGYCLQSKCSARDLSSIKKQNDELIKIEELTSEKGKGAFISFIDRRSFRLRLTNIGEDPDEYIVFDRTDLVNLETSLAS